MAGNLEEPNLDETDSFIDEDDVEELEERGDEEEEEERAQHSRFELSDCKRPLTSFFITDILDPQKFKGRTHSLSSDDGESWYWSINFIVSLQNGGQYVEGVQSI